MTVNDFNSKINLPKFFLGLGLTDYRFIKIPTYGWFAFNQDHSVVLNTFDIFNHDEASEIYKKLTMEKPEYIDFKLRYSEMVDKKLSADILVKKGWHWFWAAAKEQAETGNIRVDGKLTRLNKLCVELGYPKMISHGQVGVVTEAMVKTYSWLGIPPEAKGKLLIPFFHAPNHLSALAIASVDKPENQTFIFKDQEIGWCGKLGNRLAASFTDVCTNGGFTWDYKADYWTDKVIMDCSPSIEAPTLLKIWTQAKTTRFDTDPLVMLKDGAAAKDIQHHIRDLNYEQIKKLEDVFSKDFVSIWKNLREQQVSVGSLTFIKKHSQYFVMQKTGAYQFTNFTIEVNKIEKRDDTFYRIGHIYCRDSAIPFCMSTDDFGTTKRFLKVLTDIMLEAGVGVPIVTTGYKMYLLDVINTFNEEASINTTKAVS